MAVTEEEEACLLGLHPDNADGTAGADADACPVRGWVVAPELVAVAADIAVVADIVVVAVAAVDVVGIGEHRLLGAVPLALVAAWPC